MLVKAEIGPSQDAAKEIELLVDTGAFYTALPSKLMRDLGIEARWRTTVTVADNRQLETPVGAAYIGLNGREGIIFVTELDVPVPLLGVMALETLGFKVDPVERRLEPTRPFGPAAL